MAGPMMPAAPTTADAAHGTGSSSRRPRSSFGAQRQPQLQPVAGIGGAAAGERLDLADAVAQRVPVDAERGGGLGPAAVGLDVGRERLDQRRPVTGVVGAQRAEHRLAVELHTALVAEREQELDRAQVAEGGHGRGRRSPGAPRRRRGPRRSSGAARPGRCGHGRRRPRRPRLAQQLGRPASASRRRRASISTATTPSRTLAGPSRGRLGEAGERGRLAVAGRRTTNVSGSVPRRPNARVRRRSSRGADVAGQRRPPPGRRPAAARLGHARVRDAGEHGLGDRDERTW